MTLVRLKPPTPRSRVKHSTTEPHSAALIMLKWSACQSPIEPLIIAEDQKTQETNCIQSQNPCPAMEFIVFSEVQNPVPSLIVLRRSKPNGAYCTQDKTP